MTKYKKHAEHRDFVISFDETNNGLGLPARNRYYTNTRAMIVTGYMMVDPGRMRSEPQKYEGKKWGFGPRRKADSIQRANDYLNENSSFLYTLVTERMIDSKPMSVLKAEAMARLTFQFLKNHDFLNRESFGIITDEMDGPSNGEITHKFLEQYLGHARLDVPHSFEDHAELVYPAVKKADMAGYCLAAIHLYGDSRSWPRRNKMVATDSLEKLTREIKRKKYDKRKSTK